jgi:hypothetical protein
LTVIVHPPVLKYCVPFAFPGGEHDAVLLVAVTPAALS